MIRFNAAGIVGLLWFPIFAFENKFRWKAYVPIAVLIVVVFAFKTADDLSYKSEGWENFRSYNSMRSKVQDNPNSGIIKYQASELTSIAVEDIELFNVFCPDTKIVTLEKLRTISALVDDVSMAEKFKNLKKLRMYLFVFSIILLFTFLLILKVEKHEKFFLVAYVVFFSVIMAMTGMKLNLQNRVWIIAMLPVLYTMFYFVGRIPQYSWLYSIALILVSMLFMFKYCKQIVEWKAGNDSKQMTYDLQQKPLLKSLPKSCVLYNLPSSMYTMFESPFKIKDCGRREYEAWCSMSSLNEGVFVSYDDLVKDNVYMFMNFTNDNVWIYNRIIDSMKRNYGIEVEHISIAKNETHELFKLVRKN